MTEPLFTLVDDRGRPYTINQVAKDGRWKWRAHTATTRQFWWALGNNYHVRSIHRRHIHQVRIEATPLHKDGRSPQDIGACAPHVKAAIDGLVDAGLIPDDNPKHLTLLTFDPPRVCGIDGLELRIYTGS